MKNKYIYILLALIFTICLGQAQTASQNYIHSFTVQVPGITDATTLDITTPTHNALQEIQYFDGLGRPLQTVQVGITPEGYDMIKPIKLNEVGLDEINYEPYAINIASGEFRKDFETEQPGFYSGLFNQDPNGRSPINYERSPLNRVLGERSTRSNVANHWTRSTSNNI